MLFLASKGKKGLPMLCDIAQAEEAPRLLMAEIFQELSKKGLVTSHVGICGGFANRRPPERGTPCGMVMAIDGHLAPKACLTGCGVSPLPGSCTAHPVWERFQALTRGIFSEVSLKSPVSP